MNRIYFSEGTLSLVNIWNMCIQVLPTSFPYPANRHDCKLRTSCSWFPGAQNEIVYFRLQFQWYHYMFGKKNTTIDFKQIKIGRKVEIGDLNILFTSLCGGNGSFFCSNGLQAVTSDHCCSNWQWSDCGCQYCIDFQGYW